MREAYRTAHPLVQLMVLIAIGFGAMFVLLFFTLIPTVLAGVPISNILVFSGNMDPHGSEVLMLKVLQIMQAIGLFVVPYIFHRWVTKVATYKVFDLRGKIGMAAVFALSMLASLPAINLLAEWNSGLHLPEFLSGLETWIYNTEQEAETLIRLFLTMDTAGDLAFNLLLIAVLPAISEELFFRGAMQPLLLKSFKNPHVAIWSTAILFSFFHMQFLGFVPRMLLGVIFGYAAHWSGSLALPMIGHLINNGLAVLLTWYIGMDVIGENVETIGANDGEWTIALIGTAVLTAGMTAIYFSAKRLKKQNP